MRLIGSLPAVVTVRGKRFEVRLGGGSAVHPSYLGAWIDGTLSYWLLSNSLGSDQASATEALRTGIPVPVHGAETVVEICRQLVRDKVFEVVRS